MASVFGDCRLYVPVAKQFSTIPLGEAVEPPKPQRDKCRFCEAPRAGNSKSTICKSDNCIRLRRNESQKAYYHKAGVNRKRRIARG
jgi:hypothetical protein